MSDLRAQSPTSNRYNCVIFSAFLLLATGCTSTIHEWRLSSPTTRFLISRNLCSQIGKRIAVVSGGSLATAPAHRSYTFQTSTYPSWETVVAEGNLSVRVNAGEFRTYNRIDHPAPEDLATLDHSLEQMGFSVVNRRHVQEILEENDLQSVLAADAPRVGSLVGADVLAIVSVIGNPRVAFVSSGTAWATSIDYDFRSSIEFVSVTDGASYGSTLFAGSIHSFAGLRAARAIAVEDGNLLRVEFEMQTESGPWHKETELDLTALLKTAEQRDNQEFLEKWKELCVDR